jgi:hypothetical protein
VVVLAVVAVRGLGSYASGFPPIGGIDFLEYWGAARLLLHGGNPYDPVALLAVEQAVGWPSDSPIRMWNPPWTLGLVLPLTALPFRVATLVWFFLLVLIILGCGLLLWRYFAPGDHRYWIGIVLALGFVPGISGLRYGQISPWLLLGVVGFLCAERAGHDILAGASLSLLMIKPHVAYLFWLAALWWILRNQRWRVLIGWLAALAAASGLALLLAPDVFANYLTALANPPLGWRTPTFGRWLRVFFGLELGWLQFLPSLLGVLGLVIWLWRRRGPWRWQQLASPLLLASVVTTSYGWSHDQVVLLPVVVDLIARLRSAARAHQVAVIGLLILSQVALMAQPYYQISDLYSVWHPLALAGLYAWGGHIAPARTQEEPALIPDWQEQP